MNNYIIIKNDDKYLVMYEYVKYIMDEIDLKALDEFLAFHNLKYIMLDTKPTIKIKNIYVNSIVQLRNSIIDLSNNKMEDICCL